ncbi:SDR family oxidoreductase [Gorillibacterium massiliense]|uniref:SDR family oxidoreductase n=1 Tax=Gorillibacterium massiliense TaxID=1280390 RepID=UPI0004B10D29|nr:SDR family NAD(P)-dependent oxidoreductase [Gorillibacterium massiliense]
MNAEKPVAGKIAIITGGGSGIGRASAILLARQGAKVCLLDRTPENAKEVQQLIVAEGGEACYVETDISVPEMVEKGMRHVVDLWGRLDIVFANAGINGTLAPIEEMTVQDWETTMNINLKGTFLTVKYAVPYLKKNGGSIIITSSINGNRVFSNFGFTAYSTSKAGQVAFMQMAALELAKFKIRVNAICPGAIETNIGENTNWTPEVEKITIPVEFPKGDQPLQKGPGQPEHVADLVLFLSSDASSHITGTPIYIDGAESLLHG